MDGHGRTRRIQYNLATGPSPAGPKAQPGETLSSRRFLTRLHLAQGYPYRLGARWAWAVAVELMAVSMTDWGSPAC